MSTLTQTELKQVRQYLSPNIRMEIDMHLRTELPMNASLVRLLREMLGQHSKEIAHGKDTRRA